jgi:tRNA1(Val) A37 N6-methylase TrmN6
MVGVLDMEMVKEKARNFSFEFANKKMEGEFYHDFDDGLLEVFGVSRKNVIGPRYQRSVRIRGKKKPGRIDFLWPSVLLIENKSRGENLEKAYEQAEKYYNALDEELKPKYIIVTYFENIHLYNGGCKDAVTKFKLENLESHVEYLGFIADPNITANIPVSEDVADTLSLFYERLRDAKNDEEKLTKYLMRLIFCMFAEDTDIFKKIDGDGAFFHFIDNETREDGSDLGSRLHWLFEWLNTPNEKRDGKRFVDEKYCAFPYVNGGLFDISSDLPGSIDFDGETREILISCTLADWKNVSPSIFGTLFQERMDKYERRQLGAHYTSEKCIHRVIDPLFLNDLNEEFNKIGVDLSKLDAFHEKIANLKILDPACGCGSFLVIAYASLRDLEIEILRKKLRIEQKRWGTKDGGDQVSLNDLRDRRVSIQQFYGIEIQPFPAEIAKTAMILIDHKKNMEVSKWAARTYMRIPLERYENIRCEDALSGETKWEPDCDYIIGNPPFVDAKLSDAMTEMRKNQKNSLKLNGNCDYVCCWFAKCADYMQQYQDNNSKQPSSALVATSSIVQGNHVKIFTRDFLSRVHLIFAYEPFRWDGTAAVWVVILGFRRNKPKTCRKYKTSEIADEITKCKWLNAYLEEDGEQVKHHRVDISKYPKLHTGFKLVDYGHLFLNEKEFQNYIETFGDKHFVKMINADDLINGTHHYWLKLIDVPETELSKEEKRRGKAVSEERARRGRWIRKKANTPFIPERGYYPTSNYLAIAITFKKGHGRIPMEFMPKDVLCTVSVYCIENPSDKLVTILQSREFYDYVSARSGRLGNDGLRFTPDVYYSYLDRIGYTEEDDNDDFL